MEEEEEDYYQEEDLDEEVSQKEKDVFYAGPRERNT